MLTKEERAERRRQAAIEASEHPIAWFSHLLHGVERNNQGMIYDGLLNLQRLGYSVAILPRPHPQKEGTTRRPGRD